MYDPALGRWHVIDRLAERYYSFAPYVYCANNPIRLIDIDGRYFDDENEKRAQRKEKRLIRKQNRLANKVIRMAAKGKDTGDIEARQDELDQSLTDISDMRTDKDTEFRYASVNSKEARDYDVTGPTTMGTGINDKGDDVITMFTENTMGSILHEGRHGGDVARGDLEFNTTGGYGVSHEISAYRAQYSWAGILKYRDEPTAEVMMQRLRANQSLTDVSVFDINQINKNMVNSMVDPGFKPIYPPRNKDGTLKIPLHIWNNN